MVSSTAEQEPMRTGHNEDFTVISEVAVTILGPALYFSAERTQTTGHE